MKKYWLAFVFLACVSVPAFSQTLFTYGPYKADASEFIRAFNKNNQVSGNKTAAIRDYLELYINSRLKIRQAYDRGYDTLPQIKSEVENLRSQIIENYMGDPLAIDRLTQEAFQRSLKDIHTAHIFIADDLSGDSAAMRKKLDLVIDRLEKGEDFLTVAQEISEDPAAKTNRGDLNYITVFTLPYEFENIIYATAPGKYSKPYRSTMGYHIFKNMGERKGLGKIKIQHLLLAFSPGIDEAGKNKKARLADSLYQRILAGDDFGALAMEFGNDLVAAASGGHLPEIVVGQYEPGFESAIWSLPKDGAVSKPILTSHGYHIVKRTGITPVVTNPSDKANLEELKQRVLLDERLKTAKNFIYTRVEKNGFQKLPYNESMLWALSDSLLDTKPAGIKINLTMQTPLFKIGEKEYLATDWINYAQSNRYRINRGGIKPYNTLMDEFVKSSMYQYYREHLEDFNPDFRNQMSEFRDGNLFFEIMQQEVWNKAQADSSALMRLYEQNKNRYNWKQSAEAVIFFCLDEATARTLSGQIKQNKNDWKKLADAMNEKVVSDSGRYEWQQIPGLGKTVPQPGTVTAPVINTSDNTASFAFISKVYTQPSTRSFNEAKGLVMNDYQAVLEEQWIRDLKKKYPVVVDQKVLAGIAK